MSFPSGTSSSKEKIHSEWATNTMEALLPIWKRESGEYPLPYRATATTKPITPTAAPPGLSPNAHCIEHYPSQSLSMSEKSNSTSITMVGSEDAAMTYATTGDASSSSSPPPVGKHGWRFYSAFGSLCIISLVCALDMTSLSVALPVGFEKHELAEASPPLRLRWLMRASDTDHSQGPRRHRHRSLLVRHFLPPHLHRLSAELRVLLPYLRPETHGLARLDLLHRRRHCLGTS